ncbi:MAG: S-adenosylmethionine:tRNA ribosyltransferase-isomerase [Myxococcales bacterium]
MIPARWPREEPLRERMLHLDRGSGDLRDGHIGDLASILTPGDVLVVNDAATLPGSLRGSTTGGLPIEARLVAALPDGGFRAVLFGAGDWRSPTERREPPPPVRKADLLRFAPDLAARVESISPLSERLVDLRFDCEGASLWSRLYANGRPVQYSYAEAPLELWHVQVGYASRPWAAEMPSAGRPLRWELLLALRRRGIAIASLTHAAGLSSTGDPDLDGALPLPERFEIPQAAAEAITAAHGRVVAVGTSVVRALEGAALRGGGVLRGGSGETDLILGPGYRLRVTDGLLTGVHEKSASHYALLHAFASADLLDRASAHAEAAGYLSHEFGDSWLIL